MTGRRGRLAAQGGFTLIEMLVSLTVGMIVLFAAFDLVDRALPASTRVTVRVTNVQRGRVAMERIVRELRSATCLQTGTNAQGRPVFAGPYVAASATSIRFYSGVVTPADAQGAITPQLRQLDFNAAAGTITETPLPAGQPQVIASDVQPADPAGVFAYSAYRGTPPQLAPVALQGGAVAPTDLPSVASIDVGFRVSAPSPGGYHGSDATLRDSVGSRVLTDLSSSDSATKGPQCQL